MYGGAIEDEGDGIVVNNSYFQQNTATSEGGAIADYESMTLNNDIFNYNFGPEYGGGVYTEGDATIHGITLKGNQATYGGGLYNDDVMTLTGSSFTNNSAVYGGGMYNEDEATVDGTSFQQNSASTAGGGIYEDGSFAHLFSSRVMFNHAPSGEGGGIYNNDSVTLADYHGAVQHREQLLPGPVGHRLPGALSPAPAEGRPHTSPGRRLTARSRTGWRPGAGSRSAPGCRAWSTTRVVEALAGLRVEQGAAGLRLPHLGAGAVAGVEIDQGPVAVAPPITSRHLPSAWMVPLGSSVHCWPLVPLQV